MGKIVVVRFFFMSGILQYSDMCFNTDWQFEAFKESKSMGMILCVYMLISK